jgi:hypothetical protein
LIVVKIEPFVTLGKASLRVFCAHIFFVFVGLALLYGDFNADGLDQLHGFTAILLLAVTFTALILVAGDEVRKKRLRREERKRAAAEWEAHRLNDPQCTDATAIPEPSSPQTAA